MIDSKQTVIVAITEYPEQDNSKYVFSDLTNQFSWLWGSEKNVVSPWGNSDDVTQLHENLKVCWLPVGSSLALPNLLIW